MEIKINGRPVQVDDSFRDAPRDVQEKTIDEFGKAMGITPDTTAGDVVQGAKSGAVTGAIAAVPSIGALVNDAVQGPMNLVYRGIDAVAGTDLGERHSRSTGGAFGSVKKVAEASEGIADNVVEPPASAGGKLARATTGAVIESLGGSGLFKVAGRLFSSYPEAAAFLEKLGADVGTQAAYSAAAGAGGEIAAQNDVNPLAGAALGLVAAAGGHATARAAPAAAKYAGERLTTDMAATTAAREKAAGDRLRAAASDPDAVVRSLDAGAGDELVPRSTPTLFEATGDTGIGAAQRRAATEDTGGYRQAIEERRADQNAARVGEIKAVGGDGTPTDILSEFKRQRAELDAAEDAKVSTARGEAETTAGEAGTAAAPEAVGAAVREPVEASRRATAAEGGKLYDAIAAQGVTVGTGKLKAAVGQHFQNIAESPLSADERHFADLIKGYGERTDFGKLQSLRSEVAARARQFTSPDTTRRRFTLLKNAIDEAIDSGLERATKHPWLKTPIVEAADDLTAQQRRANAHWRDYKQTYGKEPITAKAPTASGFRMLDEAVPAATFVPGNVGGARLRALKAQGATEQSLVDSAALSLQQKAIRDGVVDPAAFRRWAHNHAEALSELPDAARRGFQSAADASETLRRVTLERQTALRGFDESAVGKVLGVPAEDLEKSIGSYLQTPSKAHELANAVSANPAAKAGLQRLTADYLLRQFTSASDDVSKAALTTFIKRNKASLAAVFGNEGMQRMQRLADDVERSRKLMVTGKDPAGPSTAADLTTSLKNSAGDSVIGWLAASMFGPKGMALLGMIKGGKVLYESARLAGVDNVDKLFAQALLDPNLAKRLLTKAPALKSENFMKGLGSAILRSSALGAARGAY